MNDNISFTENNEDYQFYALVEIIKSDCKSFKIVNYDQILSKHNVLKPEIPVLVILEDEFACKAIIKSVSDILSRLVTYKNELQNQYFKSKFKRERQDDDTQNNQNSEKRRKLSSNEC
ncbi:PREDICTED: uncharacterized protein LOC108560910 [Nicrophorus vespilloides]|uniref:Uncharacterized protein LOC108560910 n=1 Tax=Nicrophorus vespilloides TaxID=110193 RepID=A0ABM1MHR9_NICVS|nr:PREDICTED: uncharacterized protein LOC108560910 [Nicrophorus vespilloides]